MPKAKPELLTRLKRELAALKPSTILAFDAEVARIPDIIKLTVGEPDFNTPAHIKAAAKAGIDADHSHYAPSNGTLGLRRAAAQFLQQKYGITYDPETEVIVTAGATEGIYTALSSILNQGDEVLIPTPIFPLYIPVTILNGAVPVFMDTSQTDFVLTADQLARTIAAHPRAKAVVLNFPSNPTGVTYRREALAALADVLRGTELFVIADEIYSELTYGTPHVSMAALLPEQTILLNGVSKSHAMTGWRIGLMCAPAAITTELSKIHQFTITTTTANAQDAAEEAFRHGADDGRDMAEEYQRRRDFVQASLTALGFTVTRPEGAFYLFAQIPTAFGTDSTAFCRQLAHEAKVAVVPGAAFGPGGEGYVRVSYAAGMSTLRTAMSRLDRFINN